MPSRPFLALVTLAALAPAVPAAAPPGDADVRCILAGNAFGMAEKDPAKKQLALATSLFFAGRADARLAPARLKALVASEGKALGTANAAEVMTACARSFQAKERAMQAIGQQVAQAQQGKPQPAGQPAPKK